MICPTQKEITGKGVICTSDAFEIKHNDRKIVRCNNHDFEMYHACTENLMKW